MIEITVPAMGESITEGTISKWAVGVGDTVSEGDLLLELETDKVNLEIAAPHGGVLKQILKHAGDTVKIGETIGLIDADAGTPGAAANAGLPDAASQAAPAPAADTSPSAPAPAAEIPAPKRDAAQDCPAASAAGMDRAPGMPGSPAARKRAREIGVDLHQIDARDPLGRIYPSDVQAANHAPDHARVALSSEAVPAPQSARPEKRQRMSRRRATIAKRLVAAQREAAMLTTFNEVDMTAILDIRKRRKQAFLDKHEVGLGFMSFFTKAVVGALKRFPLLNAQIDGEDLVIKQYYDIGIAVATPEGLVVPVVRDADRLSFAEIERTIASLAAKARSNKLELSDLQGGTFTITNGGVFGSLLSTPILNAPQVGILGMHKIQHRPVAIDQDRIANRPMMYVALSYDHRIVDGAEAVQFLVAVKEMLEDPETLLLEG
jgi:2-oxoglutarate dehydrogenase E2 component (dihydrolipoamide succinyltransferase)